MEHRLLLAKPPAWRIVIWGLLGLGAIAWVAYAIGDPGIIFFGMIAIPVLIALMLGAGRMAQSRWTSRWLRVILWTYLILQVALYIWVHLEKQ